MTDTNWTIRAREFANCNCSYGCPCQFNGLPTYGNCRAVVGIQIDTGHHGTTKLDGLKVAGISNGLPQSTKEKAKRRSSSTSARTRPNAAHCCAFSADRTPSPEPRSSTYSRQHWRRCTIPSSARSISRSMLTGEEHGLSCRASSKCAASLY